MTAGLHISLMGIDGAGKTSIAHELALALRRKGYTPEIVSWKSVITRGDHVAGDVLASISMAAYKLQFAEAEPLDESYDLRTLMATDATTQFFQETELVLRKVSVGRNAAYPLVSAALLELAGNYYLHNAHVLPIVKRGGVVIEESCGFKHVLKNALMAQRLAAPGSSIEKEAGDIIDRASALFGGVMKPSFGYWVDADPRLALTWREDSNVSSTNFEDYGLMGAARDATSFISMQNDCRHHFASFAKRWGWNRLEMLDVPKDRNLRSALDAIEGTLPP